MKIKVEGRFRKIYTHFKRGNEDDYFKYRRPRFRYQQIHIHNSAEVKFLSWKNKANTYAHQVATNCRKRMYSLNWVSQLPTSFFFEEDDAKGFLL